MSQTSAIYHRTDEGLRAIKVGGKWQVQRHDGSKGSRESDPWYPTGPKLDEAPNWPR